MVLLLMVREAFDEFPVQMCHFHQKMIIQRYVTRKPKLEASKDLKKIVSRLTSTTSLDGGVFTQLKKLIKLHQGMSRSLKVKLIDDYLVSYNKKL
ncbi:hypothetical protein ACLHDG_01875 [Sulfurovum sp. CS9]|uniref:hypothetical protein n=1 Tax=Sulfurovum sp. CS9 TaxID=3391146 RepID=UPI0039ECBB9F